VCDDPIVGASKPRSSARPRSTSKPRARAKAAPAPAPEPEPATAPAPARRTLIDLAAELQISEADVPAMERTAEGRPVVAWARIGVIAGRDGAPKSWVALLTASGTRLGRAFVDRAASRKTGYTVVCDDPFLMESYFVQDHPLVAGVHEASSTFTGGPEGYQGRAAFDVQPDGTIELVAVGPRDRSFPAEVQAELVRRIGVHDQRDGGSASADVERERAEREAEASVRNDDLVQRYGFPDLEGTPKQVQWAMEIRRRAFEELSRNSGNPKMWVDVVRQQTSAKWWIENRAKATSVLVQLRIRPR
jgi:hypothetical protein